MTINNAEIQWTQNLTDRSTIFPHQLDLVKDRVLLVNLSAEERKAASFLDQRVLSKNTQGLGVTWQSVADNTMVNSSSNFANFIYHVSHCGSTLLSRLLAFPDNTDGIREPLILRTLAQDVVDERMGVSFLSAQEQQKRLDILSVLWARGARHSVVKATSVCTDLMPHTLSQSSSSKAVFIYNKPQTHIETLLSGKGDLSDLKSFSQMRVHRLRQMTNVDIHLNELSIGQLAALSWLTESTSAVATYRKQPTKVSLVEFDEFLRSPIDMLLSLYEFLEIPASKSIAQAAVNSPIMRTYSKAPEYEYSANTRRVLLNEARIKFKDEIAKGMQWIEQLANQSTSVANALQTLNN